MWIPFEPEDPAAKAWAVTADGHQVMQQAPLDIQWFLRLAEIAETGNHGDQ